MPKYTHRQQLISTKTIAEIARQVHDEETDKLIKRDYLFGDYDAEQNLWSAFVPPNVVDDKVYWSGRVVCMTNFRKVDNQTRTNIAVVNDVQTMRNETTQALEDGQNVVAPDVPLQTGRRTSNSILIHAVSAVIKLKAIRTNEDPEFYSEHVKFKYGFYTFRKIDPNGFIDWATEPGIRSLIKWKPQGYSNSLDNLTSIIGYQGMPFATVNLEMLMNSEKTRKLVQDDFTLRFSNFNNIPNIKTVRIYKTFKDPIEINFDPKSQTGREVLNQKVFFAIQSDMPAALSEFYEPRAQVITKVYYTNKL